MLSRLLRLWVVALYLVLVGGQDAYGQLFAKGAGSVADGNALPGTVAWSSAAAALGEDGSGAMVSLAGVSRSRTLRVTGMGFDLPPDAEVMGIEVAVKLRVTAGTASIVRVRPCLAGGGVSGGQLEGQPIGTEWGWHFAGGQADLWGTSADDWPVSLLEDASFGCEVAVQGTGSGGLVECDAFLLTIWYTSSNPPPVGGVDALTGVRFLAAQPTNVGYGFMEAPGGGYRDLPFSRYQWVCTYFQPVRLVPAGTGNTPCGSNQPIYVTQPDGAALTGAAAARAVPPFRGAFRPGFVVLNHRAKQQGLVETAGGSGMYDDIYYGTTWYDPNIGMRLTHVTQFESAPTGAAPVTTPIFDYGSNNGLACLGVQNEYGDGIVTVKSRSGLRFHMCNANVPIGLNSGTGPLFDWIKLEFREWPMEGDSGGGGGGDPTAAIQAFHQDFLFEFQGRGEWLAKLGRAFQVNDESTPYQYEYDGALARAIQQMRDTFLGIPGREGIWKLLEDSKGLLQSIDSKFDQATPYGGDFTKHEFSSPPTQSQRDDKLDSVRNMVVEETPGWQKPELRHNAWDPIGGVGGGEDLPPQWSFTIPFADIMGDLGGIPVSNVDIAIDFSPIDPFRWAINAMFLGFTILSCLGMVWEEFRRQ